MKIIGTGRAAGSCEISSSDLDAQIGKKSGYLERKTGMKKRFLLSESETQISVGLAAVDAALKDAGISVDEIDMVISACAVPYQPIPNLSSRFAAELGLTQGQVETLDVNSTCLSFLSALSLAETLVSSGIKNRVLIVSSEVASRGLPWADDPETAAIFGDGAAAVIVEKGLDRVLSRRFETFPSGWEYCQLKTGGTRIAVGEPGFEEGAIFEMHGKDLFKMTRKHFPSFLQDLLKDANLGAADLDLVVPHQASPLGLEHIKRSLGFKVEAFVNIAATTGNQIAASIPFALDYARKSGIADGARYVALLGTSAGVSFGGMILEVRS